MHLFLVMSPTYQQRNGIEKKPSAKVHICVYVVGKMALFCSSNIAHTLTQSSDTQNYAGRYGVLNVIFYETPDHLRLSTTTTTAMCVCSFSRCHIDIIYG